MVHRQPPPGAVPVAESIITVVVTHYDGGAVSTEAHVAGPIVQLGGRVVAEVLHAHADEVARQDPRGGRVRHIVPPTGGGRR